MRYDLVYRRPCCGVSVTISGTPNGDEAYAAPDAIILLLKLCKCMGKVSGTEVRSVPAEWSYAPHGNQAVAGTKSPQQ